LRKALRVLITGTKGYLGSALNSFFRKLLPQAVYRLERTQAISNDKQVITYQQIQDAPEILKEYQIDSVLHCAALSSSAECEANPEMAQNSNVDLSTALAHAATISNVHFTYLSTDLVFEGLDSKIRISEDAIPKPLSVYAKSKRRAEEQILSITKDCCIIRMPLIYGPSDSSKTGPLGWILQSLRNNSSVTLFSDEWRTPIYIVDAVQIISDIAQHRYRGILHAAGPDRISRLEMGLEIARTFTLPSELIVSMLRRDIPSVPARPEDVSMLSNKLSLASSCKPRGFVDGVKAWALSEAVDISSN
jgi:dTDP-4-dehydrorhamnose reductase